MVLHQCTGRVDSGTSLNRRPALSVCEKTPTQEDRGPRTAPVSFLNVGPALRSRIAITFDGKPISDPRVIGYEIYNEGSDTIENAAFTITLPAGAVVLSAATVPDECESKGEAGAPENIVRVSIPYLNPFHVHKQLVRLLVFVDGETRPARVAGSGEGWSVRYSPLPGRKQMRKLYLIPAAAGLLIGSMLPLYLRYVQRILKIEPPQAEGKVILVTLPLLGLFGTALLISRRVMKTMWYRAFRPQDRTEE